MTPVALATVLGVVVFLVLPDTGQLHTRARFDEWCEHLAVQHRSRDRLARAAAPGAILGQVRSILGCVDR